MPNGIEVQRQVEHFIYPKPTLSQRLRSALVQAEAVAYQEGIDESKFQNTAPKSLKHAPAKLGGVAWTVIRISNCTTPDLTFQPAADDALAADMPVMIYANVQGYASGLAQAEFAMNLAQPFIKVCKHKVILLGDFEYDWMTMTIPARQKLALDFLNGVHAHYDTGIYSNYKYWVEMYGDLKPPSWAWLWGAHWTNGTPVYPPSWDLSMLISHQYAVWDNQSWGLPVAGNVPDIDKNHWVWAGGDVNAFLKVDAPVPPVEPPVPPEEHTHPDLQAQIAALAAGQAVLAGKVEELENIRPGSAPFVWFVPTGGSAVIQHASKWYRTSGGIDKPIFAPVGSGTHPKVNGKVRVFPLPVTGDGGQVCYMLLDQVIDGETVYVRRQDGAIQEGG